MPDREKVVKGLHKLRRYLEDKEWSDDRTDKRAGEYVETVIDVVALLKAQEEKIRSLEQTIEDVCCGGQ